MNIVFVKNDSTSSPHTPFIWRGEMWFKAIKKTNLHNVELIDSNDFSRNSNKVINACQSSQLIVIEVSPDIDLLKVINYWKSRGKKVVVDISITSERNCTYINPTAKDSFSLSQIYAKFQTQDISIVDQSDKFRWGLHLADCILVSSHQQTHWQLAAPIKIVPEYIELESIQKTSHNKYDKFGIGIITNCSESDPQLLALIDEITKFIPQLEWFPVFGCQNLIEHIKETKTISFSNDLSSQWPNSISRINLAIFWDMQPIRGEFQRNMLEFMANKISWILNDQKGYQEFLSYGLIINAKRNWQSSLIDLIHNAVNQVSSNEEGYIYAIGQNIEEHIHEILTIFSDIIKLPS